MTIHPKEKQETLEEQKTRILSWWIQTRSSEFWRLMEKAGNILTGKNNNNKNKEQNDGDVH